MTGQYQLKTGDANFAELILSGAYYVDKTALLKEVLTDDKYLLFTRPRRFGKTLNLSMIAHFCRLNYQNPGDTAYQQEIFLNPGRNLKVAGKEFKALREKYMGQYPVVYLSFKEIKGPDFSSALCALLQQISALYESFFFLTKSDKLPIVCREAFASDCEFLSRAPQELDNPEALARAIELSGSFMYELGSLLQLAFEREVLILLDECDVPLQQSVVADEPYYESMLDIMSRFGGSVFRQEAPYNWLLKTIVNWLLKTIVADCFNVARQSGLTDAGLLRHRELDHPRYLSFFGFTEDEVRRILSDFSLTEHTQEVSGWYGGYHADSVRLYCPGSLMSYCKEAIGRPNLTPHSYWDDTCGHTLLSVFATGCYKEGTDGLQSLLDGKAVVSNEHSLELRTYPHIQKQPWWEDFLPLLLHTGYVTYADESSPGEEVKLKIPNLEVRTAFVNALEPLFAATNPARVNLGRELLALLLRQEEDPARHLINKLLRRYVSVSNHAPESYYHEFMLSLLRPAASSLGLQLQAEPASADGYSAIMLLNPTDKAVLILGLKKAANTSLRAGLKACEEAVEQLSTRDYLTRFKDTYQYVSTTALGFGGRYCEIKSGELSKAGEIHD
ncbi:MAG: AAA family ATPase [Succinivibrio sp.]|nr:AAA family ATPase [Succinivibrio sp.]